MSAINSKRAKRNDTIASYVIATVGISTIFSVLAILFVVFKEFIPLFETSRLQKVNDIEVVNNKDQDLLVADMGVYFEKAYTLDRKGTLTYYDLKKGKAIEQKKIHENKNTIKSIDRDLKGHLSILWNDNSITEHKISFTPKFEEGKERAIVYRQQLTETWKKLSDNIEKIKTRKNEDQVQLLLGLNNKGEIVGRHKKEEEDFAGDLEVTEESLNLKAENPIKQFTVDHAGRYVYALTSASRLYRWDLEKFGEAVLIEKFKIGTDKVKPTSMTMLLSDQELAIGYSDGHIEIYSPAFSGEQKKRILKSIHRYKVCDTGIATLTASPRNRTLFAIDNNGKLHLNFTTNERYLTSLTFEAHVQSMSVSKRGKGWIGILDNGAIEAIKIKSEHPEASISTLFERIWYAGYEKPEYVWQSSSGSDDFEPKFSLIPLIFGTLKGALYAMLFSIPLAVLAALYTSQFAGSNIKNKIKPMVEVMAAVPTVVIGFLAALWFAPILHEGILTALVLIIAIPLVCFIFLFIPSKHKVKDNAKKGKELVTATITILVVFLCVSALSNWINGAYFDNNFKTWLITFLDGDYDMRNSIVISFAMGFAVIPIIFTMSEDAMSNVPKSLSTASLALGATPWQTVWKVILPAASPGIFAGIILGFGRSVGETMIVLMATGNTPIIDFSPFNGFRAISANIAVEIPEAPQYGTLYRILFFSAAVLLIFTSFLNTITEIIRQRLRKTYSKF